MAGSKNLKPNTERTAEELKAMGAKGGKASGEAKRRRKNTKALIRQVLDMRIKTEGDVKKALRRMGYDEKAEGAPTVEMLMNIAIANQAMNGDITSARFLYDYAHVPDIRMKAEQERMKLQAEKGTKVDLNVNTNDPATRAEIEALMQSEQYDGPAAGGV